MKKVHSQKCFIYLLSVIMILIGSVAAGDAANPSGYRSLHGDFGRAGQADSSGEYSFPTTVVNGYINKFRVFIPPGAIQVNMVIYEYGNQQAIARFKNPPQNTKIPSSLTPAKVVMTLDLLAEADQLLYENKEGKLLIVYRRFGLDPQMSGWLYVYVGGGTASGFYQHQFSIVVKAADYNDWYSQINWEADVEGVTTFQYREPSPLPEKPVVSPKTGNWTTSPQNITITSANADTIYASFTSSQDGSEPPNPEPPTDSSPSQNGSSWTMPISAINSSGITRYKYLFSGKNSDGSTVSDLCSYTLDLTPYKPDAVVATPGTTTRTTPFTITASSVHATKIYYTLTDDGSTPAEPDAASSFVTGPSGGSFQVNGISGEITTYRVLFKAFNLNSDLWGDTSAEYIYVIDRSPVTPGTIQVTPSALTGSWTSAPQTVSVGSVGATHIYKSAVTTTDGSEPANPAEPTASSQLVATGDVGNYTIPSNAGKTTRTKVRFVGYNADGALMGAVSPIYSYSIVLPAGVALPGSVTVSPTTGSWTDANRSITASCTGATQIWAQMSVTMDGTEPPDPQEPVNNGFNATRITGASGTFGVPSNPGQTTRVKMIFAGYNSSGYGPTSPVYSYSINLSSAPTPTPTPTPTPGSTPGSVSVNPTTGNWTAAGQKIAVSAANATQIDYAYRITTDGTDPAEPGDPGVTSVTPNPCSNPFIPCPQAATTVTDIKGTLYGASENFTVPSTAGTITKIKIKFCGKNAVGYGTNTQSYSYTIDLKTPISYKYPDTISPANAKATPGVNITPIIQHTVGGVSILDPTAKFLAIDLAHAKSIVDLIAEYLKTTLKDTGIQVNTSGEEVMIISSPKFGGTVFSVIIGSLFTSADSDYIKTTDTGNIEICTNNIKITLYPAGVEQARFKQTIESYGCTVSFAADHVILIAVPDISDYVLAYRFQFYADRSKILGTEAAECLFSENGDGKVAVIYPDGTRQNLVPYIHDPDAFAALFANDYKDYTFSIDSNTGQILIKDAQHRIFWKGIPEYKMYTFEQDISKSEVQPFTGNGSYDLKFLSTHGLQVLWEIK